MQMRVDLQKIPGILSSLLLFLAFVAANLHSFVFAPVLPAKGLFISVTWLELEMWIIAFALMILLLLIEKQLTAFLASWKGNWSLVIFIFLAFLSLLWTISWSATFVKALTLLFSSILGAYISFRYNVQKALEILFWVGVISILLSFALGLFPPYVGQLFGEPYGGAWRGLFWHKNHLGSMGALFNLVFLVRIIDGFQKRQRNVIFDIFFYILSFILVYLARSATGYILMFLLNVAVLLIVIWLRIRHLLRPLHYYLSIAAFGLISLGTFLNLDFIFRLLNRTPTLTGRTPLWAYLIGVIVREKPWLGHGFGALWSLESFRRDVQRQVGWPYPVVIGDDGFLDILLGLGIIGLLLFLIVFITSWVRATRFARSHLSILYFFPLLFSLFLLVSNISYSLFLETNSMVWMLMITCLFLCGRSEQKTSDH